MNNASKGRSLPFPPPALTLALGGDPSCRWAWSDRQQYLEAFPRFARAFGGGAIDQGTAHYYEGFCGVAFCCHRRSTGLGISSDGARKYGSPHLARCG